MTPDLAVTGVETTFYIVGVICLVVVIRVVAGILDKQRIEGEINGKGGTIESIRWTPFARGWLGSKNERFYEVVWEDSDQLRRRATVKTAMLAGNYFADSEVTGGETGDTGGGLAAENQRLRRENEELRRELEARQGDSM
ncbi:MAG TPA: hypothetical protein EYN79_08790 [Planctomycetes bacterium]|nr:hypothetical protein [Planctomycetota bacterium]HIN81298.1 hypothetical protein [Planctomycetota bacterium]